MDSILPLEFSFKKPNCVCFLTSYVRLICFLTHVPFYKDFHTIWGEYSTTHDNSELSRPKYLYTWQVGTSYLKSYIITSKLNSLPFNLVLSIWYMLI